MNVNGNFKDNLMGKKKVIFIGCLIFAVALIAAILHMVSGGERIPRRTSTTRIKSA